MKDSSSLEKEILLRKAAELVDDNINLNIIISYHRWKLLETKEALERLQNLLWKSLNDDAKKLTTEKKIECILQNSTANDILSLYLIAKDGTIERNASIRESAASKAISMIETILPTFVKDCNVSASWYRTGGELYEVLAELNKNKKTKTANKEKAIEFYHKSLGNVNLAKKSGSKHLLCGEDMIHIDIDKFKEMVEEKLRCL